MAAIVVIAFVAMETGASASLPEFLAGRVGGGCFLSATRPPGAVRGPYPNEDLCLQFAQRGTGDWYELVSAFTSTSGAGHLVAGSNKINCTKDTNTGDITGKKTVGEMLVTFTGCKLLEAFECKSKGAKAEEIMTVDLKGPLGYINKSTKLVGVKLEPETASEYTEGEIECASNKVKVTGAVIGDVSPTNKKSTTETLEFKASGAKQANELIEIEGKDETGIKLRSSLNGGTAEEASEETTDTLTFEELVELMA
jgi:hypothetical protein